MIQIILGTQSPRRRELFEQFAIPYTAAISHFDESSIPFKGDPEAYATVLSEGKAKSLGSTYPDAAVITADSVVYCHGKVYGKPKDKEDAFKTLSELSDEWHSVFTALTLQYKGKLKTLVEETRVLFNPLTPENIRTYIEHTRWSDKAGGYGIQMGGGLAVRKIEGCYNNVMGLPINALRDLLLTIGIDLWNFIRS